jgi:hypothetical protein
MQASAQLLLRPGGRTHAATSAMLAWLQPGSRAPLAPCLPAPPNLGLCASTPSCLPLAAPPWTSGCCTTPCRRRCWTPTLPATQCALWSCRLVWYGRGVWVVCVGGGGRGERGSAWQPRRPSLVHSRKEQRMRREAACPCGLLLTRFARRAPSASHPAGALAAGPAGAWPPGCQGGLCRHPRERGARHGGLAEVCACGGGAPWAGVADKAVPRDCPLTAHPLLVPPA